MHLPPETYQKHLHVEQFSLKTTLKLAERLLFVRKIHTELGRKGRAEISSGLTTHQRGHRRKGVWRSSLGSEQFKSHI